MKYDLKAKGLTLTPAIKAAVEKAMAALDLKTKRFGASVNGEVELMKTTKGQKKGDIFRAEIHVRLPSALVYAEAELDNLYTAITAAKREAEAQIAKYKGVKQKASKREAKTKRS